MRTSEPAKAELQSLVLVEQWRESGAHISLLSSAWESTGAKMQGLERIVEWSPSSPRQFLGCTRGGGLCLQAAKTCTRARLLQATKLPLRMLLGVPVLHEMGELLLLEFRFRPLLRLQQGGWRPSGGARHRWQREASQA